MTDNSNADDDLYAYGEALYRRYIRGEKRWMDFDSGEDWIAFTDAKARHDSVNRTSTKIDAHGQARRGERPEDRSVERSEPHDEQQG